jgi:uncharacterized protein (DUF427 family)
MPKAIWNGVVIAEANDDEIEIVDGSVYFPMESVHRDYLVASHTVQHYVGKGHAGHFHVVVGDNINEDAAWIYRNPQPAVKKIIDHVAFRHGIEIRP